MRITDTQVWRQDLGLTKSYTIAGETISSSENAFVKLILDNGIAGIGSASPSQRVCGESMDDCHLALEKVANQLKGEPISHFAALRRQCTELLRDTPAALAAVDIALFDAHCQWLNVRIVDYLGLHCQALPTSVTIGIKEIDGVKQDLEEYLAAGFQCIKVKIGNQVEHDVEVIRKMREWCGQEFRIRVDGNQGYSVADLFKFVDETRHLDIELIEQPFHAPAVGWMHKLNSELVSACMADEDLLTMYDALALIEEPLPYGMWNIKLMKSGGITGGKAIADIGQLRRIPLMWGCMDESRISISAALHTAYACANTAFLDLDGSFDLATDVVAGGFVLKNGHMHLTDAPGLGVQILER